MSTGRAGRTASWLAFVDVTEPLVRFDALLISAARHVASMRSLANWRSGEVATPSVGRAETGKGS